MSARANYLIGNDPKHWHTKIPLYGRVLEHELWPGIDVAWYGNQGRLESDFIVAPGATPSRIQFSIDEKSNPTLDAKGNLRIGPLELLKPLVYQQIGNQRRVINCRYAILRAKHSPAHVRFEVASYDRTRSLVIDPKVNLVKLAYWSPRKLAASNRCIYASSTPGARAYRSQSSSYGW